MAYIFGLNHLYLNKVNSFRTVEEIAHWLSGILSRFTDQVFGLPQVKHLDVISRAITYVKDNYMNKITLEETSEYVYLSPSYFSRIFKMEMGINFNKYINQVRVEAARKLLLNDQVTLVDVSSRVGFEEQSYFSKVFKKMTDVTPSRYRESRGKVRSIRPLAFATYNFLPSGLTDRAVGYQPTGIRPRMMLIPRFETSTTATSLLVAFAT